MHPRIDGAAADRAEAADEQLRHDQQRKARRARGKKGHEGEQEDQYAGVQRRCLTRSTRLIPPSCAT